VDPSRADSGAALATNQGTMAGTKLDGAGAEKMKTLEEALSALQTVNGMVERMAMELKRQRPVGIIPKQIKRNAAIIQGQLKGRFELIADQFTAMVLVIGRGGGDVARVRALREYVAQIRTSLELAEKRVKDEHSVPIDMPADEEA
jgi:hypothetical protein